MRLGSQNQGLFFYRYFGDGTGFHDFYLAYKLISWIDVSVNKLIPLEFRPDSYLPYSIPGLGVVLLVLAMILIGMFAAGFLGKVFPEPWRMAGL